MLVPRITSLVQSALLTAAPMGGQHTARRNAWAAMSQQAASGRARREAELAVAVAARRACPPAAQAR